MIGLLLAVAILILQRCFGMIPEEFSLRAVASIALPYTALFIALSIWIGARSVVELDAEQGEKIVELTPLPLTPLQQEQLKTLGEIFDDCGEDALKILGKMVSGPLLVVTALKSPGAEDFNCRCGRAIQQGVFQSTRSANGLSDYYDLQGSWRPIVERYVNNRLGPAAISSSIDQT